MTLLADTSGLLAYFNSAEPLHATVAEIMAGETHIVVSPCVVAELGYIIGRRIGPHAETAAISELGSGAYDIAPLNRHDLGAMADLMRRYVDQPIGTTDASLVVLAERHSTRRVLTLDQPHFSVLRTPSGYPFEILP